MYSTALGYPKGNIIYIFCLFISLIFLFSFSFYYNCKYLFCNQLELDLEEAKFPCFQYCHLLCGCTCDKQKLLNLECNITEKWVKPLIAQGKNTVNQPDESLHFLYCSCIMIELSLRFFNVWVCSECLSGEIWDNKAEWYCSKHTTNIIITHTFLLKCVKIDSSFNL